MPPASLDSASLDLMHPGSPHDDGALCEQGVPPGQSSWQWPEPTAPLPTGIHMADHFDTGTERARLTIQKCDNGMNLECPGKEKALA